LGSAQWLALRRLIHPGGWWILVNGLGWMAGMILGAPLAEVISVIGALLVTGVISGAITGFAMQRWVQLGWVEAGADAGRPERSIRPLINDEDKAKRG